MEKELNENWAPVLNYEGLYEASDLGRIRSLNYRRSGKTKLLKPGLGTAGYLSAQLCKDGKTKNFGVQRLVVEAFHGPIPPGMQVNHLNEIKTDNRLENLEVVTAKQNSNHGTRNERVSLALKGRKVSADTRAKLSAVNKGKKLSEEHKSKIGAGNKGKKVSADVRAKMCEAQKTRFQLKPHSAETRAKMSASHKGKTPWNKGKKNSGN